MKKKLIKEEKDLGGISFGNFLLFFRRSYFIKGYCSIYSIVDFLFLLNIARRRTNERIVKGGEEDPFSCGQWDNAMEARI